MPQFLEEVATPVGQVGALLAHFDQPGGWIKGSYSNGNGGYCLERALVEVQAHPADSRASVAVKKAIGELYPRYAGYRIPVFNDAFFTDRRRVKKVLLRARQILQQQQEAAAAVNDLVALQKAA